MYVCAHAHAHVAGDRETLGGGREGDRISENGPKATPCTQEVTNRCIVIYDSCTQYNNYYSSALEVTIIIGRNYVIFYKGHR